MAKTRIDVWNPDFMHSHALFWPIRALGRTFARQQADWPGLDDYQQLLNQAPLPVTNSRGLPIRFVPQAPSTDTFDQGYEPRIYLQGEVQTRQQCWHDFFQVLVWRLFPAAKAALNDAHYQAARHRQLVETPQRRSTLENALTQFDECGAIVVSSRSDLLDMIRRFEWHKLFWQHRVAVAQELKCIVFGHAIYEKALQPYIGLTAHSLLLGIDRDLFHASEQHLINFVDRAVHDRFADSKHIQSPQDFSPLPLLGFPGWHADNQREEFYSNTRYFRPGRHFKTGS